jgi:hypothetical protein
MMAASCQGPLELVAGKEISLGRTRAVVEQQKPSYMENFSVRGLFDACYID